MNQRSSYEATWKSSPGSPRGIAPRCVTVVRPALDPYNPLVLPPKTGGVLELPTELHTGRRRKPVCDAASSALCRWSSRPVLWGIHTNCTGWSTSSGIHAQQAVKLSAGGPARAEGPAVASWTSFSSAPPRVPGLPTLAVNICSIGVIAEQRAAAIDSASRCHPQEISGGRRHPRHDVRWNEAGEQLDRPVSGHGAMRVPNADEHDGFPVQTGG